MDGAEHGAAVAVRELTQQLDDGERGGRVEAGGGLVEQQQRRLREQLLRQRETALLPSRQALHEDVAHDGVLGGHEAEPLNHRVDLVGGDARESRRVEQHLAHREHAHERVLLLHVHGDLAEAARCELLVVQPDLAKHLAASAERVDAPRDQVEERRLSGPRWTHQRDHLARLRDARAALQHLLVAHTVGQVLPLELGGRDLDARGAAWLAPVACDRGHWCVADALAHDPEHSRGAVRSPSREGEK